jgi:hypothetical protein
VYDDFRTNLLEEREGLSTVSQVCIRSAHAHRICAEIIQSRHHMAPEETSSTCHQHTGADPHENQTFP